MMKSLLSLCCVALASLPGQAEPFVADSFFTGGDGEYIADDLNRQAPDQGGIGWTGPWSSTEAGNRYLAAAEGNLKLYSDGKTKITRAQPDGDPGHAVVAGDASNGATTRHFSEFSGGDLYFSFLFQGEMKNPNANITLGSQDAYRSAYSLGNDGGNIVLRYKDASQEENTSQSWEETKFIVGRITNIGRDTSTFTVWVNPEDLQNLAKEEPIATLKIEGKSESPNHFSVRYFQAEVGNQLDELRLGKSFEDVTGVPQS